MSAIDADEQIVRINKMQAEINKTQVDTIKVQAEIGWLRLGALYYALKAASADDDLAREAAEEVASHQRDPARVISSAMTRQDLAVAVRDLEIWTGGGFVALFAALATIRYFG